MVRSSTTKSTKEKKSVSTKPALPSKSKTPVRKTGTESKKSEKVASKPASPAENTARGVEVISKNAKAGTATQPKTSKKDSSSKTKAIAEKKSVTEKTKASAPKRRLESPEPQADSSTASQKAKPGKTSTQEAARKQRARSVELPQRTPELFEGYVDNEDVPFVSVIPPLRDNVLVDNEQSDLELKTPAEFKETPIVQFSADVPLDMEQPSPVPEKEITFSYLGFNDVILGAIRKQKFEKPTRVQALCLPHTLDGKDVAGFAQTGTGKTAVYLLTAAHKLLSQENRNLKPGNPHILVIVPTRELADQVSQDAKKLLSSLNLRSLALFGGVDVEKHVSELAQPIDIIVSTPGRLLDLHRHKHIEFHDLQMLVIDECDRMFDMGFVDDVEYVLRHLPTERVQKLLFSATGSEKVKELAFEYLDDPEYVETDPVSITPEKIAQVAFAVTSEQKFVTLMGHLRDHNPECAIVFTNTKVVAEWVGYKLACNGLNAEVLTGDLPQRKRMTLIKKIKEGKCNLLVATDVLSRGLHVANLSHVYNFDIPDDAESFIHRIGRTARAGAAGNAITLICEDYGYNMGAVEKLLGFKIPLAQVPAQYLAAEDISDYPFDESGRVKVFGQQAQVGGKETAVGPTPEHARERQHKSSPQPRIAVESVHGKPSRPESTLPQQHKPKIEAPIAANRPTSLPQPLAQESGPSIPQAVQQPIPQAKQHRTESHRSPQRPHAAGQPQAPTSKHPSAGAMQHAAGAGLLHKGPIHSPVGATHSGPSASGLPRRDDKARETIELAIQAAKTAAARRKGSVIDATQATEKTRKTRVTSQIDEIASSVLISAQERINGTIGNLQDRFMTRFEENFPKLSETLVRLGFFSKRFTDER